MTVLTDFPDMLGPSTLPQPFEVERTTHITLPADEMLAFAKRLCAERGIQIPEGDCHLASALSGPELVITERL